MGSSQLVLQSPLREPSRRRPSQPPWPGVVAGLSEALMPTLESSPTRSCWPVESVAASCAADPSLAPTRSSLPDIAVTVCLHPSWELRLEATTSTRTIRTRLLFAVSDVGLHEDYDSWNINNDICMLTLEGSISMGSNVGTIGLPSSMEEYAEGTICTVSGWGTTTEGGSLARVLQKVDVP